MPVFSRACAVAAMGAVSMKIGSAPRTPKKWMRARGFSPCRFTAASLATRTAVEASEICEDTAAVIRSQPFTVGSEAIFSSDVSGRMPSSRVTPAIGATSRSKRPSSQARAARRCDSSANSSMSSRVTAHFSAIRSAP